MSVYLGDQGQIQLQRSGTNAGVLAGPLEADDVNVAARRFSWDFPPSALVTGDRLRIATADGLNLQLVAGHDFPDGAWYINVNDAGGIRLYTNYGDAINGQQANAIELEEPIRQTQNILANTESTVYRCLGQVKEYSLTTSRQNVDTTSLGDEFIESYKAGLISGQGNVTCLWDYKQALCDPFQASTAIEEPQYFASLVLRMQLGAQFLGRFYIKYAEGADSLWWEAECIVTNVGFNFSPTQIIETQIAFVTTGKVVLKHGVTDRYLLQQDGGLIDLEDQQEGAVILEEPD